MDSDRIGIVGSAEGAPVTACAATLFDHPQGCIGAEWLRARRLPYLMT